MAARPEGGRCDVRDQNKAVVRRFITELLTGGNPDVVDDRLADGRIVEDDPITTPDLTQVLAAQLQPAAS